MYKPQQQNLSHTPYQHLNLQLQLQTESISIKTTYPNEKATKIVIDLMQMVIKLWGIEKPINTNPLIDNLNSNKDN